MTGTGEAGVPAPSGSPVSYADAGVDLEAADASVDAIRAHAERTRRPEVLDEIGGFGGMFALDTARYRQPVLVTGTDGVGTKLALARQVGVHHTVGIDLVAMVVDDIVVSGAEPQVFLDYIAIGRLDVEIVTAIVAGIAEGCVRAGCALVGGETAEHPGVMPAQDYDLAGFGVGVVERDAILGPHRVHEGDVLVGMPSSGLHSNGFSLVRRIVERMDLQATHGLQAPLGEVLLTPTAIYVRPCLALAAAGQVAALCHVTGGGLPGNLPRVLPDGLGARIDLASWTPPDIFDLLARSGPVDQQEMFRAFNMGVGMVAVVPVDTVDAALATLADAGVAGWVLGRVTRTPGVRLYR